MKHIPEITIIGVGFSIFVVVTIMALTVKPKQTVTREPVLVPIAEPVKDQSQEIREIATANGFKPSKRIISAILNASETYQIDAIELTAIAIVETGLGKYSRMRKNKDGTHDKGLFQINTVNWPKCVEYNLDSPEGSSLCAAKLLSRIKSKRADYLGVYHSKTPSKKVKYIQKITKVLSVASDN